MSTACQNLRLSCIVLSHNRCDDLDTNLDHLLSDSSVAEVIVVDNASSDGTLKMLEHKKATDERLNVISLPENLGVAGGRNAGWAQCTGDILVSLDDDSKFDVQEFPLLKERFLANPDVGVIAFRVVHAVTGDPQNDHGSVEKDVANHHGAGCAIRREILDQVGHIDPECTFGAEEIDICIRIRDAGFRIVYMPEFTIRHNNVQNKPSPENLRRRKLRVYNNVRTHFKYFPWHVASMFGLRYLTRQFVSASRTYSTGKAIGMFADAWRGFRKGRSSRHPVNRSTVRIYSDSNIRPDFGNVPLWKKLAGRMQSSKQTIPTEAT